MQHDHALKRLNFDLLTRSGACVCVCVGGAADKISATMLLLFVIPFNLICNMTMYEKVEFRPIVPSLGFWGRGYVGKIFATMLLHS